jgi:hypothetical protein
MVLPKLSSVAKFEKGVSEEKGIMYLDRVVYVPEAVVLT